MTAGRRGITRALLLPAALALSLPLSFVAPSAALGHAELVSSDPAASASLPEPPTALHLTFTEPIDAASSSIRLLDTQQAEVPGLGQLTLDAAGTTVEVSLPELDEGTYTVSYQVTSATDGHVTSGLFAFLVDPSGTQPPPPQAEAAESLSSGLDVIGTRWLALIATLATAGILLFWLASARPVLQAMQPGAVPAPWAAIVLASGTALAGVVAYLILAARPIIDAGGGSSSPIPFDFAAPFGWTSFAIAMRVSMLGLVATTLLATSRWLAPRSEGTAPGRGDVGWMLACLAAVTVAMAGMSFAGHAAATGGPPFALVDLLHLLGVAAWLGTLPGLFLLVRRARAAVPFALRRHSRMALVAAPLVVVTGLASSPLVLGASTRELVSSGYGNLLLAKAGLFSVAVGMGAVNFFVVRRGMPSRGLLLIVGELVVGAVAVLAAATMVTGQPAATRAPVLSTTAIGTAHLYGVAGESSVHAAVNLPAPGNQLYQVSVADAQTGAYRTDVQRVILVLTPPAGSELASERIQLEPANGPGLWALQGAYTPVVGTWTLDVIVRREGLRDETATFPLPVALPRPPDAMPPPDIGIGVPLPLAALWAVLPAGGPGWLVPIVLLAVAGGLALADRRRRSARLGALQALVVMVAVVAGIGVASRAAVTTANDATPNQAALANPIPASAESVQRGGELYSANCATCHGAGGKGDGPTMAGALPPLRSLADVVPGLSDGAIARRIEVGTAGTRMPAFAATLSENDRWDLVNYLRATWPDR